MMCYGEAVAGEMIPLRELRNHTGRVLRRVEAGERLTVTVDGRPVVDLVPHSGQKTFVSRDELVGLLRAREPTPRLREDVRRLLLDTTDDV
jgi:prevent-host-death family protein